MKSLLQELTNYWFYPILFAVAGNCVILQFNSITLILWIYSIIRLVSTGKRKIIYAGFLCSFFTILISINVLIKEEAEQKLVGPVTEKILRIHPDKIKVDGDLLQVEGDLTEDRQLIVKGTYQLSSEQEQQFWLHQTEIAEVCVSGSFELPSGKTNLNGFDYAEYLRQNHINQILRIEKIHSQKDVKAPFFSLFEQLSVIRKKALLYCNEVLYPTTAVYCKIFLFGERAGDDELNEIFTSLGILHLFSLSGMHVAFFANLLRYTLLRLGVSIETFFWWQLLLSFLFAGLTGFSVSVVRALLQRNLSEGSNRFRLHLSTLDIWSLTLFFAVLIQPFLLFTLAGQYSYFLSFSIIYLSEALKTVSSPIFRKFLFSALLSIFTIPILGMTTYEWQPLGILLTFILLPFFENLLLPALTSGFVLSFILKKTILSQLLEICLIQMNKVFASMSEEQFFSAAIGKIPFILFAAEIILVLLILFYLPDKKIKALVYTGILVFLLFQKYVLQSGIVAFIDVGQGDSIFIQAPFGGESILIDTGGRITFQTEPWRTRTMQKSPAEYTVIPFLKSRGVKKLDKVFITHSDTDHMGDLLAVSEKIKIESVYFSEGAEQDTAFFQIIQEMERKGTSFYSIKSKADLPGELDVKVLAPMEAGAGSNDDSLVLYTNIMQKRFLFTGDLEETGEKKLVEAFPALSADILKVGHHGSKTSTTREFLKAVSAQEAVISCGQNNHFNHPHEETLEKLNEEKMKIYRTDKQGMIYCEWSFFSPDLQLKTVTGSD
ncbi:DNA internalization-related competence protein ComEC/Rec2 [Enterococcus sp. BWB1-3]|uniref:DNA internalization-related competence protein ComEC/Rec2 n=1 Tax=Enterococcus sp. BWB1-3 TaxID=2787713 RepID=UPI00192247F0|nr:DNA internalization-related competence protein ComEC/Rec2 [Enterococcus sp. BWB1-3]MBL1229542.1 DNA internalization-related competence protein ComEC/Rec2 [Enterococcus sp. BWB1-3]